VRATILYRRSVLFRLMELFLGNSGVEDSDVETNGNTSNAKYRSPASRYETAGLSCR
jgi:hypothetical protein